MSKPSDHVLPVAWAILLIAGGFSLTLNLVHAFRVDNYEVTATGIVVGSAAVFIAVVQSHNVAAQRAGWFKMSCTYVMFAGAALLSINTQAEMSDPYFGVLHPFGLTLDLKWVVPLMLDLSAFNALHTVMTYGRPDRPRRVDRRPPDRRSANRTALNDPEQSETIQNTSERSETKSTSGKRGRSDTELRVELAAAISAGEVDRDKPTAEAIRTSLRIAPDKARQLRDELNQQRAGLNGAAK